MEIFGEVSSRLCERSRLIAAVLAITRIAMATFFLGAWATSSQIFTPPRRPKIPRR